MQTDIQQNEIVSICEYYDIENYTINNGLVDVDGHVGLSLSDLSEIPIKFGEVTGNFYCTNNKLTSLIGCPTYVGGNFDCSYNQLTSLIGCPTYVGGNFDCSNNQLTSLIGCPEVVFQTFNCSVNNLESLELPRLIGGDLFCSINPNLFTISELPEVKDILMYNTKLFNIYALFPDIDSFRYSLDYNYFVGGNIISKVRLTHALLEFGFKCPNILDGYEFVQ